MLDKRVQFCILVGMVNHHPEKAGGAVRRGWMRAGLLLLLLGSTGGTLSAKVFQIANVGTKMQQWTVTYPAAPYKETCVWVPGGHAVTVEILDVTDVSVTVTKYDPAIGDAVTLTTFTVDSIPPTYDVTGFCDDAGWSETSLHEPAIGDFDLSGFQSHVGQFLGLGVTVSGGIFAVRYLWRLFQRLLGGSTWRE